MRIVHFEKGGVPGIAADDGSGWHGLTERESGFPGTLPELIAQGADLLRTGRDLLPMHGNRPERSSDTASGAQAAENPLCRSQLR